MVCVIPDNIYLQRLSATLEASERGIQSVGDEAPGEQPFSRRRRHGHQRFTAGQAAEASRYQNVAGGPCQHPHAQHLHSERDYDSSKGPRVDRVTQIWLFLGSSSHSRSIFYKYYAVRQRARIRAVGVC